MSMQQFKLLWLHNKLSLNLVAFILPMNLQCDRDPWGQLFLLYLVTAGNNNSVCFAHDFAMWTLQGSSLFPLVSDKVALELWAGNN